MSKELEDKSIEGIQEFLDWQVEMRMREGDYSPQRYAEHLYHVRNQKIIDLAIAMLDKYNLGSGWNDDMISHFGSILKSNK